MQIPDSVEWFIGDQAFSLSYDLAPLPDPPLPSASCLSFSVFLCFATEGGGAGRAKSDNEENGWSSKNHSMLSGGFCSPNLKNDICTYRTLKVGVSYKIRSSIHNFIKYYYRSATVSD